MSTCDPMTEPSWLPCTEPHWLPYTEPAAEPQGLSRMGMMSPNELLRRRPRIRSGSSDCS